MRNPRLPRIPRPVVAAGVIAGIVVALSFAVLLTSAGDHRIPGCQTAQASPTAGEVSAEDLVIATIAKECITLAQFNESLQHQGYMEDISQGELDGLLETGLPRDFMQARQDIAQFWGADNVALAVLVRDSVLYQKAVEKGIIVTRAEIDASVQFTRQLYETGGLDAYNAGFIELKGEDRYWSEVLPRKVKRDLMIAKLRDQHLTMAASYTFDVSKLTWRELVETTLAQADIRLHESGRHTATLEGILEFHASVQELDDFHVRYGPRLPRAPEDRWVVYIMPEQGSLKSAYFEDEPTHCYDSDTDLHRICDAHSGEVLIELASWDLYVIVQPGEVLPVFEE